MGQCAYDQGDLRAADGLPLSLHGERAHRFVPRDDVPDRPFGGNQLAVIPDATGIPEEALLALTREFNFSETTFC
ncbi:MAG: PhzF family phenazine biosynthesis protein, partial [Gemmatimonadota bacterium]